MSPDGYPALQYLQSVRVRNLLSDDALENSHVVANCRMNRERNLTGSNGYSKEIGFNPVEFLRERVSPDRRTAWLDLCCGTGKALIQAAQVIQDDGLAEKIEIVGVDLVGMFLAPHHDQPCLHLVEASLSSWNPTGSFDLITCVHGLHYVGDKLGLISRAVSWLTSEGLFVANLDMSNVKFADGSAAGRRVPLSCGGLDWNIIVARGLSSAEARERSLFPSVTLGVMTKRVQTTRVSQPWTLIMRGQRHLTGCPLIKVRFLPK